VQEERERCVADGNRSSSDARPFSKTTRQNQGIRLEAVCVTYAAGSRVRVAKDVSFLRTHYVAVQNVLPGVREIARSGHDKIER